MRRIARPDLGTADGNDKDAEEGEDGENERDGFGRHGTLLFLEQTLMPSCIARLDSNQRPNLHQTKRTVRIGLEACATIARLRLASAGVM